MKRSATGRLRRFWLLFALLLAVIVGAAYFAATWPGFDPSVISVSGNDRMVPSQQIVAAAAISRDRNMWLQNTRAAAARIEAIPLIDTAWVHRRPPATVAIVVTQRLPVAIVASAGRRYFVDAALRVLYAAPSESPAPFPVLAPYTRVALVPGAFLKDEQSTDLIADLQLLQAAHVRASLLSIDKYGDLTATLRNGVAVLLGDDDLEKKIALIDPILAQLASGRPLRAIDLRALDAPVVEYK
jgi:cell division protein FtsQ